MVINMKQEHCGLVKRFFRHWLAFSLYVLLCAQVVMRLEGEAQSEREVARKAKWNETRAKLINAVNIASVEAALEDEIAELIALGHGEGFDPNWDLVNSLYYCSSLYTTVGKVAFSIGSP